jgi:thiol-disulfide isomerase/thioredoxin
MLSRIILIVLITGLTPMTVFASESNDYELRDLDGNLHRVSDYRGKWLIINFWATWCPPCIAEMPELELFYKQNKASAQVWGVTFEDTDKAKIRQFIERLGVTYPVLGYGQDPLTGFGTVTVLPTTFVIDKQGLFLHRFEGPITAHDITEIIDQSN